MRCDALLGRCRLQATEDVTLSLKNNIPHKNEINTPIPIHTGADLDNPDFFTAKADEMFPIDHKMPDKIPKYKNTNESYKNEIITVDTKRE